MIQFAKATKSLNGTRIFIDHFSSVQHGSNFVGCETRLRMHTHTHTDTFSTHISITSFSIGTFCNFCFAMVVFAFHYVICPCELMWNKKWSEKNKNKNIAAKHR